MFQVDNVITLLSDILLIFLDVVSQVYKTHNKVDCRGHLVKETGFCIKVFKVENSVFKEKVWEPLKNVSGYSVRMLKRKASIPDVF